MTIQAAEIAQLTMETDINAPPETVWKALTEDIGKWWPADFFAGGVEGKRTYILEARPGGKMFEVWDGGGGVLWGTVVNVEPNVSLQVLGALFPNWGGPSQWYGTWKLRSHDGGTKLTFSESSIGKISDGYDGEKTQGWTFLWNSMKAFVEGAPPPTWQD